MIQNNAKPRRWRLELGQGQTYGRFSHQAAINELRYGQSNTGLKGTSSVYRRYPTYPLGSVCSSSELSVHMVNYVRVYNGVRLTSKSERHQHDRPVVYVIPQ